MSSVSSGIILDIPSICNWCCNFRNLHPECIESIESPNVWVCFGGLENMKYATWGGLYCLILFVVNHSAWVDYPPFWVYPHLWWPYLLQFSPAPRCRCIVASFSLQSIVPIFLLVFPFFNMGLYGNISSYVPIPPVLVSFNGHLPSAVQNHLSIPACFSIYQHIPGAPWYPH